MIEPLRIVLALADDDGRAGLTRLLGDGAYQVHVVEHGRGAWEFVARGEVDILIAGGGAPEEDGLGLFRGVRERSSDRYVYLILLADRSEASDVVAGFSAGADDYITGPIVAQEFLARVKAGERVVRLDRALRGRIQELGGHVESLREQCARLERATATDPLTGMWNRRRFEEEFAVELAWTRRVRQPLTLAMIDLDHFKRINDRHGHVTGDEVLRRVAQVLQAGLRSYDVAARLGGEEFGILFRGTTEGQAAGVCERIRIGLQSKAMGELEVPLTVTASFGLASLGPEGTSDLRSLMERADRALYEAKCQGRNRIVIAGALGSDGGRPYLEAQLRLVLRGE
jgi:diguanylate cyclase (GGDEF)-like protein